ncbi:DUF6279 family lipoprotein [Pseudoalteromonas sp.]|uniref:DUF6279 family lipoprotein n=1 Tax=Pseudoalteromonas sp. TaxID=53249 RepID=UPI003569FE4E
MNASTMIKKSAQLLLACSFLLLTSCSTTFAYNNLTWLSSFWVDDYVDLNNSQTEQFKDIIKVTRQWHRSVELPKYKQDLLALQHTFNSDFTRADLSEQLMVVKRHWSTLLAQVKTPLTALAATLSSAQRSALINNIRHELDEELENYNEQDAQKRQQQRLAKQLDYYKQWLGKLTPAQTQLITTANEQHIDTFILWQHYRQTRLNALQQALNLDPRDTMQFNQQMELIISDRDAFISDELAVKNQANLMNQVTLLVSLNATLSNKQRRHVNKHFAELIDTVDGLIDD